MTHAPPDPDATLCRRFASIVREARRARGWSQEQLAARAELNRSYMGEVERGDVQPSLHTASKVARALDQPLSALIAASEAGVSKA